MRVKAVPETGPSLIRRSLERLDALPMRPTSARQVLASRVDDGELPRGPLPRMTELDPSWAVEASRTDELDPLACVADRAWWTQSTSPAVLEALNRLWRHSAAVSFAARRLAREANEADPDRIARAGFLANLGLWAVSAVDPGWLVAWLNSPDEETRREFERRTIGTEASNLGRTLAVRWACEPLVVDAAWLHGDRETDLGSFASDPTRLALVQEAFALAERTPWAIGVGSKREAGTVATQTRILMAEVQARCGGPFVEADASAREERLTRDNARLHLKLAQSSADRSALERFATAVAGSSPNEGLEAWSDRSAIAWCGEPGVASAKVVWTGFESSREQPRPPTDIIPLGDTDRPCAQVHLWQANTSSSRSESSAIVLEAWNAWARATAERVRLEGVVNELVSTHRGRVSREEPTLRRSKLEALAEFAAGAGHELNNPLAVILGRAQLLSTREQDPDVLRSLKAIITQAQRAHRILRDLMYFARPPEPRPRACLPDEIVRASLRDLQLEAESRGVRIAFDPVQPAPRVWSDPDPLRQVADVLARNALEATPSGGMIQISSSTDARKIRWTIHDNGRGVSAVEGAHLFDPFYCGRQAGRGLGLGLPRVARIVEQAGGELKWQSNSGQGTTFHVTIPVLVIPTIADGERPGDPRTDRAMLGR